MLLILGGDSEIGGAIYRTLRARNFFVAATTRRPQRVGPDRPLLDLSDFPESWEPPDGTRTACVCAAVARLADCAADPQGAARVNVVQTLKIVDKLLERSIYVLFLSTNQVFDGTIPYAPTGTAHAPTSEYGRQKARTEAALRQRMDNGAPVAILRLSKVIAPQMPLIHNWIDQLKAGKPIRAFRDMTLSPVPIDIVVAAIAALANDRAPGIYQLSGRFDVSYADLARFIARQLGRDQSLVCESSAYEAGLPAGVAPPHTTLDSSFLCERYGLNVPSAWDIAKGLIAMQSSDAIITRSQPST